MSSLRVGRLPLQKPQDISSEDRHSQEDDSEDSRWLSYWLELIKASQGHHLPPQANFVPLSGVDPFRSSVVSLTKDLEILFKYYWTIVPSGSHLIKNEILPHHVQEVKRYTAIRNQVMQDVLRDPVILWGLMYTMSARMQYFSHIQVANVFSTDHYMHLAVSNLRQKLSHLQPSGEKAQVCAARVIHTMALAEWTRGNFQVAKVHLLALKKLLPWLDLSTPFGRYLLEGAQGIDIFVAVETGEAPILAAVDDSLHSATSLELVKSRLKAFATEDKPLPNFQFAGPHCNISNSFSPRPDFLDDAHTTLDFRLGQAFEAAIIEEKVEPLLVPVIESVIECLTFAKYVWRTPYGTTADAGYVCRKARATIHKLCTLPGQLRGLEDRRRYLKADCIRLAMLLYMADATTRTAHRSAKGNVARLRASLIEALPDWQKKDPILGSLQQSSQDDHFLLWVLATGHYYAGDDEQAAWFLVHATEMAQGHGIADYEGLHEHLIRFIYSSTKQARSLRSIALLLSS